MSLSDRWRIGLVVALVGVLGLLAAGPARATPIKHVVVIYQENHSFDNVLGRLCRRTQRCDGARFGRLPNGRRIPLRKAKDVVPSVAHSASSQTTAIDGGKMDGFARITGCGADKDHRCFTQYKWSQIPNLASLARRFVISDRTFETDPISSWGAHLELVAAKTDGFTGENPHRTDVARGNGWGCDSRKDAPWRATPSSPTVLQPACIPDYQLDPARFPYGGAYRPTQVKHIPTIMDELDRAGLRWRLYSTPAPPHGYLWSICPTFAGCLYTHQHRHVVHRNAVITAAKRGRLPAFGVVLPKGNRSQHNSFSMAQGDNWIGRVVHAIGNGPDWRSTAIFITYDDCGCFYDHVAPPRGLGIRVPMVIVSPYAKLRHTDSRPATMASLLAFTEHTFRLPSLGRKDSTAYNYSHAFNYRQKPKSPAKMTHTSISNSERLRIRRMPHPEGGT